MRSPSAWLPLLICQSSNRGFASFLSTNSNDLLDCADKNLSVAYFFGASRSNDSFDSPLNPYVRKDYLKFDLWQKIGGIFGASGRVVMPLLTAKSFNFANGHPFNPNRNQRIFHFIHFERFNDCLDLLHLLVKVQQGRKSDRK